MTDHPHLVSEDPPVLRNRLGITDAAQLARAERVFSDLRTFELRQDPVRGAYDFAHYRQIHARLLGDVYDWAGQNRDFQTQRGYAIFARPDFIEAQGQRIFARLAKENLLRGLDADGFADKVARLGADLNALHPAIDGNGRTTRLFLEQVGAQAGHPLDFSRFTREEIYAGFEAGFHEGAPGLRPLIERAMAAGRALQRQLAHGAPERGALRIVPEAGAPLSAEAAAYLREEPAAAVARFASLAGAFAAERRMRAAALELGALAPGVEQAVTVRIREHVAVQVHRGVDATPSDGILNAVRHDAASAQLDHARRAIAEGRAFDPHSSVAYRTGQGLTQAQRDWLVASADDALREAPRRAPSAARQAEARWIASAIATVDFPHRHAPFAAPALRAIYEAAQRERAQGLERAALSPGREPVARQPDPAA